jgi:hypothetical protein
VHNIFESKVDKKSNVGDDNKNYVREATTDVWVSSVGVETKYCKDPNGHLILNNKGEIKGNHLKFKVYMFVRTELI